MESGLVENISDTAADPSMTPVNMAGVRRRAWAESRDPSQRSKTEPSDPPDSQQSQSNGDTQRHADGPGKDPNKIVSWLFDCSTPTRGSIDDQSASPSRGVLRNGCSFEDDLSLGAEANHLQSINNKADPSFGLAADQKRSQFKERGRSMNSTGSGKSSTVSSVSELLDMYEEDAEEILLNLGFGRDEPDLSSKIPSRFFNSSSAARGIDIQVYMGAQMQRLEVENPNYALTSRFRQLEVMATVANEFFQLYSNVSGQQVKQIGIKDQGEGGRMDGENTASNPNRSNSVINAAKILKKHMSKNKMVCPASESIEAYSADLQKDLNGPTARLTYPNTNSHAGPEQDKTNSDHQVETVNQKLIQKKDHFPLATVTEETNGGGEADQLIKSSPEQSSPGPEHQPESENLQQTNQRLEGEGTIVAKEEINITSTPEKVASTVPPLKLAQLRTENTDSFDMEEIQTNDDEALPCRTSRTADLSRTVSQQSDSSGFAEEPSVYSNSHLKVQESSDSCDSETTVTSHPSQDITTPHALDQPAFVLPDSGAAKANGRSRSSEDDIQEESSGQIPQYTVHYLPKLRSADDGEQVDGRDRTGHETEPPSSQNTSPQEPELEHTQSQSVSEQDPEPTELVTEMSTDTEIPSEGAQDKAHVESAASGDSGSSSPVLSALNRAKRNHPSHKGQHNSIQCEDLPKAPGGRRRGVIPMERSSSLPSSLVSPARVVSSVKIQFKQGQASCTPPRYSLKYTQDAGDGKGEEVVLAEKEEEEEQSSCLSTLIINPGPKENTATFPPKPIPSYLQGSFRSLHSASPPPEWSPVSHAHSWSTQNIPELSSGHHQPFQMGMSTNPNQQSWSSGQMFPSQSPSAVFSDHSPHPSSNPSPFHFSLHPYASSPCLTNQYNPSLSRHYSLPYLHRPFTSSVPPHGSLSNLHQPPASTAPQHFNLGHQHPGTPPIHHQSYHHPYTHQLPYPANPHGSQYASPYHGTPGFSMNPHLHPGLAHSAPPGLGPGCCPSSSEMQLRKVLHEIRGTVQSLNQSRVDTPDSYSEHRGASASQECLLEFQQKRRNLNVFRSQMMDLELSIMKQQALFYKHLSPADRLEVEQLQSLRSAVREELQELEQQLEDRLFELSPHSHHSGLHRDTSVDNLSTASALRAMEPVSDLLREQFFLQSEICYDGRGPSSNPSTRSPSPVRGDEGKQRQGVYRASINITPAARPRPNAFTEEDEQEDQEGQRHSEGVEGVKKGGEEEASEKDGAAGKYEVDNFHQLIKEIRENVAQEVRREIYQELLAAASPQGLPLSSRQHPL